MERKLPYGSEVIAALALLVLLCGLLIGFPRCSSGPARDRWEHVDFQLGVTGLDLYVSNWLLTSDRNKIIVIVATGRKEGGSVSIDAQQNGWTVAVPAGPNVISANIPATGHRLYFVTRSHHYDEFSLDDAEYERLSQLLRIRNSDPRVTLPERLGESYNGQDKNRLRLVIDSYIQGQKSDAERKSN